MAKRPNGSGSIRFWRGAWWAQVSLHDGKQVRRKRRTREDAEHALDVLIAENKGRLGYFYSMPRPYWYGERDRPRRNGLSPKMRFAVLQRDGFRCRYCGRPAPDVVLHIDHVVPVAAGGSDEMENLVAACQDCNLGKAAQGIA